MDRTTPKSPPQPAVSVEQARAFRKKPVVIEAIRLPLPGEDQQKVADLFDFMGATEWEIAIEGLYIKTLEGTIHASLGDWIIKGVQGELYPCKPDIFSATYEPASAAPPADGVPAGFVLVPIEPTDAMLDAAIALEESRERFSFHEAPSVEQYWEAFLSAAPIREVGAIERLRVEVAAWRQQAINEGWSHRLADAYGREEYVRQREAGLDEIVAKRIANGLFADAALGEQGEG